MATLIKNGRLVTPHGVKEEDLLIEGGVIAALGHIVPSEGDQIFDAKGKYVLPGGIETHTHLDLEVMGMHTADDFFTGSRAALLGGTTTFLDFATQFRGETMSEGFENWDKKASVGSFTDYGYHMALTEWNELLSAEMPDMVKAGVTSFKLYQAYKGALMVDDAELFLALQRAAELGVAIGVHCENGDVIDLLVQQAKAKDEKAPEYHEKVRPAVLEAEAIWRFITLATLAGANHYVVHLSTKDGLELIRRKREEGATTVIETCPQYLFLDKSKYDADGFYEKAGFVMSPPLREKEDQEALWQGLSTGDIQLVGTDHCSFNLKGQKDHGKDGFWNIPNGAPGIELRMNLLYSGGVATGKLDIERFAELTSTNAAKYFGLYPKKGCLEVGSDADIAILDPEATWTVTHDQLHDNCDYTPYEGFTLQGKISDVFLRGEHLVADGKLTSEKPQGQFLKRDLPA